MAYVIHPEYYVIIFAALSLPIYFKNEIYREIKWEIVQLQYNRFVSSFSLMITR